MPSSAVTVMVTVLGPATVKLLLPVICTVALGSVGVAVRLGRVVVLVSTV